jgi:hypothetical protein
MNNTEITYAVIMQDGPDRSCPAIMKAGMKSEIFLYR